MTKEERKVYRHKHYMANKEKQCTAANNWNKTHKEQVHIKNSRLAARDRRYIDTIKANKPCMDCNKIFPPFVMEFDHRDASTKYTEIGNLASSHWSIKRINEEIAKCDLVCSNCHRVRTWSRKQYLGVAA